MSDDTHKRILDFFKLFGVEDAQSYDSLREMGIDLPRSYKKLNLPVQPMGVKDSQDMILELIKKSQG